MQDRSAAVPLFEAVAVSCVVRHARVFDDPTNCVGFAHRDRKSGCREKRNFAIQWREK